MQDLAEIANFNTRAEAEAAAGLLKNEGIPYLIQSQEGMMHGPLFPGTSILVAPEVAEQAREILGLIEED
ncbi:MAG: hypothetical protein AMS18_04180 [Gemmatimonas sp. SG8_17]|nr:MAG: hypothetical protein AMS18_04180 [Gemmatimonas sp. SG8_17]